MLAPRNLVAQTHDLALEFAALEQLTNLELQGVEFERLGDEVGRAFLHRPDRGVDRIRRGQDHHGDRHPPLSQFAQQIQPPASGHHEVENDEVRCAFTEALQGAFDVRTRRDLELVLEQHSKGFSNANLVVDHQDKGHRRDGNTATR